MGCQKPLPRQSRVVAARTGDTTDFHADPLKHTAVGSISASTIDLATLET